jgi:hypothetical protein
MIRFRLLTAVVAFASISLAASAARASEILTIPGTGGAFANKAGDGTWTRIAVLPFTTTVNTKVLAFAQIEADLQATVAGTQSQRTAGNFRIAIRNVAGGNPRATDTAMVGSANSGGAGIWGTYQLLPLSLHTVAELAPGSYEVYVEIYGTPGSAGLRYRAGRLSAFVMD